MGELGSSLAPYIDAPRNPSMPDPHDDDHPALIQ